MRIPIALFDLHRIPMKHGKSDDDRKQHTQRAQLLISNLGVADSGNIVTTVENSYRSSSQSRRKQARAVNLPSEIESWKFVQFVRSWQSRWRRSEGSGQVAAEQRGFSPGGCNCRWDDILCDGAVYLILRYRALRHAENSGLLWCFGEPNTAW